MAICRICGKDMLRAKGCVGGNVRINGVLYPRIGFGETGDLSEGLVGPGDRKARCGDCGCRIGQLHHFGCDMEACPKCGGQMVSCRCPHEKGYYLIVPRKTGKSSR